MNSCAQNSPVARWAESFVHFFSVNIQQIQYCIVPDVAFDLRVGDRETWLDSKDEEEELCHGAMSAAVME